MSETGQDDTTRNQFGTFGGVFTPSILTILGVIMFMRTGFVTGQAGILYAVLILVFSKLITFLTGLSISAISTNTEVKGGGAYFLISRSLGPEFGGAIGLTLYLAQAFSVPFYIIGFVEALTKSVPWASTHVLEVSLATTLALFVVNYVGAGLAIKAQYFILAILVLAIVTFMGGAILRFDTALFMANTQPLYTEPSYNVWSIFAIFFPAVTGIMAGVNMSGDLKEPTRSIPRGTLMAIVAGFTIYLVQIVLTGGSQTREQLRDAPYETLLDHALFGMDFFVVGGVFAATISSAIGSFMGAPRILQALARDNIFPALKPFAKGTVKGDEPRRGLWLTLFLTCMVLFAANVVGGDALNLVGSILTMFFLFTYGMTNMAAFVESVSGNPSFRPRFRQFHWSTALLGAVGCFGATFLIDQVSALVAMAITVVIFLYIERRVLSTTFGDARRGLYYARVRNILFSLVNMPPHPKNWRPTTLVFSGNPQNRLGLVTYATWMAHGRGLVTLAQIIVGDVHALLEQRQEAWDNLKQYISAKNLQAFPEVMVAPSVDLGMASLLQGHSLGPLKPNMVCFGWSDKAERAQAQASHMRLAQELNMSQVVLIDREPSADVERRRIDVWWRGHRNGSLMVILAYLMTLNWDWSAATIRLLRVSPQDDADTARRELYEMARAARIDMQVEIVAATDAPFTELLTRTSGDADLVLLGFQPPSVDQAEAFHAQYKAMVQALPTTLLVCSSGEADLLA
ncbi:MAG: amino acid permease [Myxococcota bacterium]